MSDQRTYPVHPFKLNGEEAAALMRVLDSGRDRSGPDLFRRLLMEEFARLKAAERSNRPPPPPVMRTAEGGLIIDGVLFTKDERLTSMDDRIRPGGDGQR